MNKFSSHNSGLEFFDRNRRAGFAAHQFHCMWHIHDYTQTHRRKKKKRLFCKWNENTHNVRNLVGLIFSYSLQYAAASLNGIKTTHSHTPARNSEYYMITIIMSTHFMHQCIGIPHRLWFYLAVYGCGLRWKIFIIFNSGLAPSSSPPSPIITK